MEKKIINQHTSIKLMRLCMIGIGMWKIEKPRDTIISNFLIWYNVVILIIALVVETIDIYYCMGDLREISYVLPCWLNVIVEFFMLIKFIINRSEVMDFYDYTIREFWSKPYIDPERKILDDCNKKSVKIIIAYIIVIQLVVWQYITIPIIESYGKNSSERTFPYNLWFTFLPFKETPYYEIYFFIQSSATLTTGVCATAFATFLFTINIYATGQFKILQRRLETSCQAYSIEKIQSVEQLNLIAEESYSNLRKCVELHLVLLKYITRLENLYCQILLVETLACVFLICLTGFQIVLGVDTSLLRTSRSAVYFVCMIIQLLLYSWSCHEIINESSEVAEAAYRAYWYSLSWSTYGKSCRQALSIIIVRSRRPCVLTVGKFVPMSLETFTAVFNSSLSYFTILRQMDEEIEND